MERPQAELFLGIFLFVICAAALSALAWVMARVAKREEILPRAPRQLVPWGGGVVLAMIFAVLFAPEIVMIPASLNALHTSGALTVNQLTITLTITSALKLFAVGCCAVFLVWGQEAASADLGVSLRHLSTDIKLGFWGLLVALIPTYTLQLILSPLFDHGHPLIDTMKKSTDPGLWIAALASVGIAAPVAEEFTCRLMLQGWLEKKWDSASTSGGQGTAGVLTVQLGPAIWPIMISSLIFAGLHFSAGPGVFSIFPLALVLGYLYNRTHRLMPGMILHALFNLLSMGVLWLTLQIGEPLTGGK